MSHKELSQPDTELDEHYWLQFIRKPQLIEKTLEETSILFSTTMIETPRPPEPTREPREPVISTYDFCWGPRNQVLRKHYIPFLLTPTMEMAIKQHPFAEWVPITTIQHNTFLTLKICKPKDVKVETIPELIFPLTFDNAARNLTPQTRPQQLVTPYSQDLEPILQRAFAIERNLYIKRTNTSPFCRFSVLDPVPSLADQFHSEVINLLGTDLRFIEFPPPSPTHWLHHCFTHANDTNNWTSLGNSTWIMKNPLQAENHEKAINHLRSLEYPDIPYVTQ